MVDVSLVTPQFRSKLVLIDDGGLPYTLFKPLVYDSAILKRTVLVPARFTTDLASIPRGLWNILPRSGPYDKAAVVHDYLYRFNGCTRAEADAVFREAMQACGVNWLTRQTLWLAVRLGGREIWATYRRMQAV